MMESSDGFRLVGLILDEDMEHAKEFFSQRDLPWEHGFLGELKDPQQSLGIGSVPHYGSIDSDSTILEWSRPRENQNQTQVDVGVGISGQVFNLPFKFVWQVKTCPTYSTSSTMIASASSCVSSRSVPSPETMTQVSPSLRRAAIVTTSPSDRPNCFASFLIRTIFAR